MTERAKIREEYKKEKRLPVPEVPKRKPSKKESKKIIVESRYLKKTIWHWDWYKQKERKE